MERFLTVRSKRGFSLIEAMVAMAILGVGLLAVLKMTYVYIRSNAYTQMRSQISTLAQDKMEELRSYAVSDRVDNFSVFDFNYLVSTSADFTTVENPANHSDIVISGLLSGSNSGAAVTTPWGVKYEVLTAISGGGGYEGSDDPVILSATTNAKVLTVHRHWTVKPVMASGSTPGSGVVADYALLSVDVTWTDQNGEEHKEAIYSCINRRQ